MIVFDAREIAINAPKRKQRLSREAASDVSMVGEEWRLVERSSSIRIVPRTSLRVALPLA